MVDGQGQLLRASLLVIGAVGTIGLAAEAATGAEPANTKKATNEVTPDRASTRSGKDAPKKSPECEQAAPSGSRVKRNDCGPRDARDDQRDKENLDLVEDYERRRR